MCISGSAVIYKAVQSRVADPISELDHHPAGERIADQVVPQRRDGPSTILHIRVFTVVDDDAVLEKCCRAAFVLNYTQGDPTAESGVFSERTVAKRHCPEVQNGNSPTEYRHGGIAGKRGVDHVNGPTEVHNACGASGKILDKRTVLDDERPLVLNENAAHAISQISLKGCLNDRRCSTAQEDSADAEMTMTTAKTALRNTHVGAHAQQTASGISIIVLEYCPRDVHHATDTRDAGHRPIIVSEAAADDLYHAVVVIQGQLIVSEGAVDDVHHALVVVQRPKRAGQIYGMSNRDSLKRKAATCADVENPRNRCADRSRESCAVDAAIDRHGTCN